MSSHEDHFNVTFPAVPSTSRESFQMMLETEQSVSHSSSRDPKLKVPLVKYHWTIKNFSMLPQRTLESPEFGALLYKFQLLLHPYGLCNKALRDEPSISKDELDEHMSATLLRRDDFGEDNTKFISHLSIIPSNAITDHVCSRIQVMELTKTDFYHWPKLIRRKEVHGTEIESMIHDTLTIKCEIFLVDSKSLRENPFRHQMANLLMNGEYSDIVLLAEGKSYSVHKVILESRCPGFLDSVKKVKHPNKFEVFNIKASDLEVLLHYLYTGSLAIMKTSEELLSVFEEYDLHYLVHALRHPRLQVIEVTSEIPVSTVKFPWVIKDYKDLGTGDEIVYPAFCFPAGPLSKMVISLTLEDYEAGNSKEAQNVFLRLRKQSDNEAVFMVITVSVQIGQNINKSLRLSQTSHQFKDHEVRIPLSSRKIAKHLREDTLILILELKFSKSPAVVKNETVLTEKLCNLKLWPRLKQDFKSILDRNGPWFSDALLQVGESKFFVHKVFLCTQSPVFERMFKSDCLESERGIVTIEDIKPETVSLLLQYMYSGMVKDLGIADAIDLYEAADKYEVLPLVKKCAKVIISSLDVKHVGSALVLASSHQDSELQSFIYDFIISNPTAVLACPQALDALKEKPGCFPDIFEQLLKRFPTLD